MRRFCFVLAASTLLCLTAQAKPPNFVLFICDDLAYLDTEPYGSKEARTPNLATFAREAMRFTHCFVASPSCGPSRTALLTGLYPCKSGAEPNHRPKNPEVASLPPALRQLGYDVAAFGKVAHGKDAAQHGFDLIGTSSEPAELAKYLQGRDRDRPVCLFLGTRHPHVPWSENEGYDADRVIMPPTHVDTPETRAMRTKYLTDVTKADDWFGKVRAMLKEQLVGETITLFTSDHGAQWPFSKWNLYDAGIRVPLLASWPGKVQGGGTESAMVQWLDVLPTFIELAGGAPPAGIDGRSFASVLRGAKHEHRDRIFTTHSSDGELMNVYPIRSVRTHDWKYIRNLHPEFQHHSHISRAAAQDGLVYWESWQQKAMTDPLAAGVVRRHVERPKEELFDLTNDPFELRNLADRPEQADRLKHLRADLDRWMNDVGDSQTVFGTPTRIGAPAPLIATKAANPAKKAAAKKKD